MPYFNSEHDTHIVNSGGFFCYACLVGKPSKEQSSDYRYCVRCYKFLFVEMERDARRRNTDWYHNNTDDNKASQVEVAQGVAQRRNMSTSENRETTVDIIQPQDGVKPRGRRRPKHRELPEDLVMQLSNEGMGSKAISTKLKEQGTEVSYKTIQRVLLGER